MHHKTSRTHHHYPFGMLMPTRTWDAESSYRFGFNGMEKDDEMKGAGNSYTTEWRQYDPRTGRWFSNEPKPVAWESGYVSFRNNPVFYSDPKGDCPDGNCAEVIFGENAKSSSVPESSMNVINEITCNAGVENVLITSTARNADDQARAMYNNAENKGLESQKQLYSNYGDQVLDVYQSGKSDGASSIEIKKMMSLKIKEVGPSNVSNHSADPSVLTVIDIAPSSIPVEKRQAFVDAVNQAMIEGKVSKFLHPGNSKDPAYHIEIPVLQKQTSQNVQYTTREIYALYSQATVFLELALKEDDPDFVKYYLKKAEEFTNQGDKLSTIVLQKR